MPIIAAVLVFGASLRKDCAMAEEFTLSYVASAGDAGTVVIPLIGVTP
jgi:hypothetical protein